MFKRTKKAKTFSIHMLSVFAFLREMIELLPPMLTLRGGSLLAENE